MRKLWLIAALAACGDPSERQGIHDLGGCGVSWGFEPSMMWMCEVPCTAKPSGSSSMSCRSSHPDLPGQVHSCAIPFDFDGTSGCCESFNDEHLVRFMVCE